MRSSCSSRSFSAFSLQQVLDAGRHRVERLRQLAELIARADRDLVREVAAAHALGAGEQLVDRPGDRARERQPHDRARPPG